MTSSSPSAYRLRGTFFKNLVVRLGGYARISLDKDGEVVWAA
ncbi:hypothetical protein ACIPSA_24060 [Streptomyces sp. NPDC086549]